MLKARFRTTRPTSRRTGGGGYTMCGATHDGGLRMHVTFAGTDGGFDYAGWAHPGHLGDGGPVTVTLL